MMGENTAVQFPASKVLGQASVRGKIVGVRRYDGTFFSSLMLPAADEFSRPQVLEIRSDRRLGDKDEVVDVTVRLAGFYGRRFKVTDRDTGEERVVQSVVNVLEAVWVSGA